MDSSDKKLFWPKRMAWRKNGRADSQRTAHARIALGLANETPTNAEKPHFWAVNAYGTLSWEHIVCRLSYDGIELDVP